MTGKARGKEEEGGIRTFYPIRYIKICEGPLSLVVNGLLQACTYVILPICSRISDSPAGGITSRYFS